MSATADRLLRRELRAGDADAIVELHRSVYIPEYGMNHEFVNGVRETVRSALAQGWPERGGGGGWLVERDGEPAGCIGLTDEGDGIGRVRWVVLLPELRGQGVGRRLLAELLAKARAAGFRRLELDTFSALTAAARMYRAAGFTVVSERERDDWGPRIVYQRYELALQ